MSDEIIERDLRAWMAEHTESEVPASLRQFLAELPRSQSTVQRVERRSSITGGARRRDLALILVAAALAVALGGGLIAGFGLLKTVTPSSSPPSPSSGPTSPPAAGPYRWTLVSSSGEVATYAVGPVIERSDGSLLAVAFGQEARVLTSPDGRTWTLTPADPGLVAAAANHVSIVDGVAEGRAGLVAVGATALDDISSGDARAWTSKDGLRWQAAPTSAGMVDAEMESVTAGPDGFVAVGSDGFPGGNTQLPGARGAAVWVSINGIEWTRAPSQTSFQGGVMFGVRRTPSGYVAWGEIHDPIGSSGPLPPIWTSSDGLHWDRATGITDSGGPGNPIASIVTIGDRLVAVGSRQLPESEDSLNVPAAWTSGDGGQTWVLATGPDATGSSVRAGGLRDVAASGSDLLAVGYVEAPGESGPSSAITWRSTNLGATWAALPDEPSFAGSIMGRVIGIAGGFVVFGAADDPNASSNPELIWLAEGSRPLPVPTAGAAPETLRFGGFVNGDVGWAMTDRRLRLTDDGGTTWRTAGPPIDYGSAAPKGVSFFDADRGWVVSEDSFSSSLNLWRTGDSGLTWAKTVLPAVPMPAETVGDATTDWIDANHAVIDVSGGMPNGYLDGLLVTADGGATWSAPAMQSATAGAGGITGVPGFRDPSTGWLAGGAPGTRLWMTRDGGQTWALQHLAVPSGYLDDQGDFWGAPSFFSATDGVVARTFANNTSTVLEIYRTSDGGVTWQPITGPVPDPSSWSFPSMGSWIVWAGSTAWRSTDEGRSWTSGVAIGLSGGAAPVMTDDQHGWSLSSDHPDELLVTADGGQTWRAVDPFAASQVEVPPS